MLHHEHNFESIFFLGSLHELHRSLIGIISTLLNIYVLFSLSKKNGLVELLPMRFS